MLISDTGVLNLEGADLRRKIQNLKENRQNIIEIGDMEKNRLAEVIAGEYGNICGIVILKGEHVVYRSGFNGYDMNTPVHVASLTKSILSALTGIALEKGYLKSLQQKVMSFFPEYEFEDRNPVREAVTIENLLNMTVPYSFADYREPLEEFSMSPDWVRFALKMIDKNGRIGDFKYSTEGAHLLSAILTRATGKSTREFANEFLFGPAEMTVIEPHFLTAADLSFDTLFGKDLRGWANDPQGITTGGFGLTMTPDDMARFGFLYMNQGIWNGKQIISKEWTMAPGIVNKNGYAFMWWQPVFGEISSFAAIGDGGNIICCIPEKQLVVAIASEFVTDPKDRCALIGEHILPLFS